MILLDKHIDFIEKNLKQYRIKSEALKEDLLDHICTYIEERESNDFNELYQEALQEFGGHTSFKNLQLETNSRKFIKQSMLLKRLLILAFALAIILVSSGSLFKVMHWPYASMLLFAGALIFILIVVPIFFYDKYKSSIYKFS